MNYNLTIDDDKLYGFSGRTNILNRDKLHISLMYTTLNANTISIYNYYAFINQLKELFLYNKQNFDMKKKK